MIIGALPDNVLLDIFEFYQEGIWVLNRNHMCWLAVHSGHWLIAAALVEHRNPLKGSSIIYTLTVISLVT